MKCSFTPYEGNAPYIFVSYSHKDTNRVFPILEQLNNRGFRVWYDEGVEWGSEWPESIAIHLRNCAVCMIFHSEESVVSPNCRQEIYYALKKRKSVLSVYLENVELTDGLDMQLSPFQSTFLYQYTEMDKFYTNLYETEILKVCRCENNIAVANDDINKVNATYVIPDGVKKIRNKGFYNNNQISQIHIPDSVKTIGKEAFYNSSIELLYGMNGVLKIASRAFQRSRFKNIILKETLKTIGYGAFLYADLNNIEIPYSVTKISEHAFSCSSLRSVIINGRLKKIASFVFWDCDNLESVVIQTSTIKRIDRGAFSGCLKLKEILIPRGLKHIGKRAFSSCTSMKEISIPDTVLYIGKEAFCNCQSLESITIPEAVRYIGESAFSHCKNLKMITIPNSVKFIGKEVFKDTPNLKKIVLPERLEKYIPQMGLGNVVKGTRNPRQRKTYNTYTIQEK